MDSPGIIDCTLIWIYSFKRMKVSKFTLIVNRPCFLFGSILDIQRMYDEASALGNNSQL